jgi:Fur family ferric uptake transcriptional regulator
MHDQEKKQFKKLFQQEGIDRFEDRFKVLEKLLQTEQHLTPEEMVGQLREDDDVLDVKFVEDTLDLLCDYGFAKKVQFNNEPVRYEHHHLGQHHDHMLCTKCGKIVEFNDRCLRECQLRAAAVHGFHMLQHKTDLYGICSECVKAWNGNVSLSTAKEGERLIIRDVAGGGKAKMRLLSMGLRLGDVLEVISRNGRGQMVVSVDSNRFILGRGMVNKIMVFPAADLPPGACPRKCALPVMETASHITLLSEMKEGETGRISRVGGCGMLRRRILEMGMTPGTEIYIEKYAPLKDPLELIVKGYHVSLRVEEAARIMVQDVKEKRSK